MREHEYRSEPVPTHLNCEKIQKKFNENIEAKSYCSGSEYNDNKKVVKNSLKKIYHYKCAFCEASLRNSYAEIEHFRPKNSSNLSRCDSFKSYYWLAFAWDNLLPSCKICNISKSNCFDIDGIRVDYDKNMDSLQSLHRSLEQYNSKEKPKLLHPEMDKFVRDIHFDKKGNIVTDNERVKYSIKVCNLNRQQLSELREEIITDHSNRVKEKFETIIQMKPKLSVENMVKLMGLAFREIYDKSKIDRQFSAVSLDIYSDFQIFLNQIDVLTDKDKQIIMLLWGMYQNNIGRMKS
ncbi:hypothetical protein GSY74_05235 [Sulfurovum sp. bin170]|uniref:hypothetical protein n=1 Tax=Sulfurovum sp. bin170 TaxID=2695268 RepID=UPI0013DF33C9|nr:hypothetical protein [Sulfurovum sp. bin170]NEW60681.1 hypothetical protein [Sulfurovum sp. bin170]